MGKVVSTNEQGLTFNLEIDDGTGKAAVKIWISDDGGWMLYLVQQLGALQGHGLADGLLGGVGCMPSA